MLLVIMLYYLYQETPINAKLNNYHLLIVQHFQHILPS